MDIRDYQYAAFKVRIMRIINELKYQLGVQVCEGFQRIGA